MLRRWKRCGGPGHLRWQFPRLEPILEAMFPLPGGDLTKKKLADRKTISIDQELLPRKLEPARPLETLREVEVE
jgi:hypothetical protein